MNYWVFCGSLLGYYWHKEHICQKEDRHNVDFRTFRRIQATDKVIYIDKANGIIIGLFNVMSPNEPLPKDDFYFPGWESFKVQLSKLTVNKSGSYMDLNGYLAVNPDFADINIDATCISISSEMYGALEDSFLEGTVSFKKLNETTGESGPTGWRVDPDLMAGLLDYYNSRAVSFASLLVASIFGLVTLSAIIQATFSNIQQTSSIILLPFIASVILYALFSISGLYMLKCYSYYTGLADKVKVQGLEAPYFKDLQNMQFDDDNGRTNLAETIYREQRRHSNSKPKVYLQKYVNTKKFSLFLIAMLLLIALLIYWPLIELVLKVH